MNNYFVRKILWICLALTFIYSLSVILDIIIIHQVPKNQISIAVDSSGNHSLSYGKEVDLFRSINRSVQTAVRIPIYPLLIIGGLAMGMVVEVIGPILVFISWFIIFYILGFIYFRLLKKSEQIVNPVSNIKLIIFCVLSTLLLTYIQFRFQASALNDLFL